jgi:hypothetical protein
VATATPITSFPWQPDSTETGKRAIGDLGVGLMSSLKTARGVHTETLLTVIGGLTGFAAQNAALDRITSKTQQDSTGRPLTFAVAHTKGGDKFLFGDAINVYLFPEAQSVLPLGALVAGAAVSAGVKEADLPNYGEIAAHVASVVGTPEFGKLRVREGVDPQLQPLDALIKFWPNTRDVLARSPVKQLFRRQERPLQEIHWPIILGLVASQYIAMTKQVLNPSISAALIMESAVITSKIDPELIEPGKWRIALGEAEHTFTRLRN